MAEIEIVLLILDNFCPTMNFSTEFFIELLSSIGIVVAIDDMKLAVEPLKTLKTVVIIIQHKVAKDIHFIFWLYNRVPILDNCFIVVFDIVKTSGFVEKTSIVTKMKITC